MYSNKRDDTLVVRIPSEVKSKLRQLAEKDRRSLSNYLNIMFEDKIREESGSLRNT
jgi:predicted DNA-binding protein